MVRVNKMKTMLHKLWLVLMAAGVASAMDIAPFYFGYAAGTDAETQEAEWDYLMKYKMFGAGQINFDNTEKNMIGFHCNHASVSIGDSTSFDVFYTTDIKISNATANTPLDKIPGMPMDFRLSMNGIPMHLEAIEFINEKISNKTFEIPEGYERVERSQMDEIFNGIGK